MSTIKCVSGDGNVLRVPLTVLRGSTVYRSMFEDLGVADGAMFEEWPLTLGPVSAATFRKVSEFVMLHKGVLYFF